MERGFNAVQYYRELSNLIYDMKADGIDISYNIKESIHSKSVDLILSDNEGNAKSVNVYLEFKK